MGEERELCECARCGRQHRKLGSPPWALSHDDLCRLSRAFNEAGNLFSPQDRKINEWLKIQIAAAQRDMQEVGG